MSLNIIHIDMDAFFASVEQLDFPELKGKPVAVGGKPSQRSVVSAASYEARKFGIHSAMPMSMAVRKCPGLVIQPVRMERYSEISHEVHKIFAEYTPLIEPISIDEAFLDTTGCERLFGSPEKIGREIKSRIKKQLDLNASVGIAGNKFLAKLASDLQKPDGFVVVNNEKIHSILDPLPVNKIWGVGQSLTAQLNKKGIFTIGQLRKIPLEVLTFIAGSFAEDLLDLANGIDYRKVIPYSEAKSISTENTFAKDINNPETALAVILDQIEEVSLKLRQKKLKAKTITIKLRFGDFQTITRSKSLEQPSDCTETFWNVSRSIFNTWAKTSFSPLRLIGFGLSNFGNETQGFLFVDEEKKQNKLDSVVDSIKLRHGYTSIARGKTRTHKDS